MGQSREFISVDDLCFGLKLLVTELMDRRFVLEDLLLLLLLLLLPPPPLSLSSRRCLLWRRFGCVVFTQVQKFQCINKSNLTMMY